MANKLTDESLMPFGKHAGKKMVDVPPDYLLWYKEQKWEKNKQVMDYINENMQVLLQEIDLANIAKNKNA
jgi:uncharacterized protein (DUF3820 family)